MRRFTVPFDIEFEDKIIGGKLSLRQVGWFTIPVIHIFWFFSKLSSNISNISILSLIINILICLILVSISCIFSFYKKNTLTYDKYLIKKFKFMIRRKDYKFYE